MRLKCQSSGDWVRFEADQLLGSGGQAKVYGVVDAPQLAVKVYHKATPELADKLRVMIQNPPRDPLSGKGHASIAWPVDLLATEDSPPQLAGYLMPRVHRVRPILEFYNPKSRRQNCPGFNYLYLHRTARNLATAINALHAKGYVIGDVNESNLLVSDTALVTLVDVDSFQVFDRERAIVYRCPVGRPDITAPELLAQLQAGKSYQELTRSVEQDLFGLAVLIFQLLMEGTHPFSGVYAGSGEPPPFAERILEGHFPYSTRAGIPYRPMALAPPFLHLHPALRELFLQCFVAGHSSPTARPTAANWQQALDLSGRTLILCKKNAQHFYWEHVPRCPWCERTEKLGGRDPFPFIPGESVATIGADGQLAAIKLPPSGPPAVVPPPPSQPLKLKVASQRSYRIRPRSVSSWWQLLRLLRLDRAWEDFIQTPEGMHFARHGPEYTLIVLLLGYPLFSGFFPHYAFLYGLVMLIGGIIWFGRTGSRPWRWRWQSLCMAGLGLFLLLHGFPWNKLSQILSG